MYLVFHCTGTLKSFFTLIILKFSSIEMIKTFSIYFLNNSVKKIKTKNKPDFLNKKQTMFSMSSELTMTINVLFSTFEDPEKFFVRDEN